MYYVLKCDEPPDPSGGYMEIEDWVGLQGFDDWGVGRKATFAPTGSVVIDAAPHDGYQGNPLELSDGEVPLVSDRLKQALIDAGVDNVDYYPVELKNKETGQTYEYFAFNIVGLVSAPDPSKSSVESYDGDYVGDSSIKDLVLDDTKTLNLLMFRLLQKFSTILIHERVRRHLEACGIDTLTFVRPEDYYHL